MTEKSTTDIAETLQSLHDLIESQSKTIGVLRKEIKALRTRPELTAQEIKADHVVFESMLGSLLSLEQCRLLHRFVSDKHEWLNAASPWYTEGAKTWLSANVRYTDSVIEYGGGRSTIWWCLRTQRASLVEASPEWTIWILLYLYNRPEALKNLRLHFTPAEWNPSFQKLSKRYWLSHRAALNEGDVIRMESDLADPRLLNGHNILVLDGAIRYFVMCRFGALKLFEQFEMVIVDNTEARNNSFVADHYFKDLPFRRLDFVAGPNDIIPGHQSGAHITSVYVREDRFAGSTPIDIGRSYTLTDAERDAYQNPGQADDDTIHKLIKHYERYSALG
ncbi:MAG: hypothetical protein ACE37J_02675 [Pikeienuella sp.]|uniref:hypothetical protein n=1 Tax=Pikeienuella sp. TaxID=2831957 RepID=UPI00391A98F4